MADEPAFPAWKSSDERKDMLVTCRKGHPITVSIPKCPIFDPGMSKRFYAAVHIAQGIVSNANTSSLADKDYLVDESFKIADALLAAEEEKS